MFEFVELLDVQFVQMMLLAGVLSGLATGIIGSIVVVKRNVFISGGIAHTTFGGIGFAYYLQNLGWGWFDPMFGAVIFAVGAAVLLSLDFIRKRFREDSTIGILWVIGMAAGVLFMNMVNRNKVVVQDPASILFGNILLVGYADIISMIALLVVIYLLTVVFFRDIEILTFDEEFGRISGVKVGAMNTVLLIMIALTVTILIKVVGVVLIIAMLTIPAAIANQYTKKLSRMMVLATVLAVVLTTLGNLISLEFDLPPGSTIVIFMAIIFLISLLGKGINSRISPLLHSS